MAKAQPKKRRKPKPELGRYGQKLVGHGTAGAYKRHQRNGEPQCDECREFQRAYMAQYRAGKQVPS